VEYLHAHHAENVSLDALAKAAYLSKYHLARVFLWMVPSRGRGVTCREAAPAARTSSPLCITARARLARLTTGAPY